MAGQSNSETSKQRPASENPYYVLATIYGEHEGDWIDWCLHSRNLSVWNSWALQDFSPDQRSELSEKYDLDLSNVPDWSSIKSGVLSRYAARLPVWTVPSPDDDINFETTFFVNPVCFANFCFTANAGFNDARFEGDVWFEKVMFIGTARIANATFSGASKFNNATFMKHAWFTEAKFMSYAEFNKSGFFAGVDFGFATFNVDADFRDATFADGASFHNVMFGGNVGFEGADHRKLASYIGAVFNGYSHFNYAIFGAGLNLNKTRFEKPCDFRNVKFQKQYPVFGNSLLHDRTFFTAAKEDWPVELSGQSLQVARATCAMLRHVVAKQGLPEDEHFFFRREMAYAAKMAQYPILSPYCWFGILSDYGHSINRPFCGLICLWGLGAIILWCFYLGPVTISESSDGNWRAFAQSAANIFPYFGFQKAYLGDYMKDAPGWLVGFSMLQTVFGALLLFLLGLGLRTRFRLR